VWYSGERKKENIRIHIFNGEESINSIEDNTERVNELIKDIFSKTGDAVNPLSKEQIKDMASSV